MLKACSEESNWPRKTISIRSKIWSGHPTTSKIVKNMGFWCISLLIPLKPNVATFWVFSVCENFLGESIGPSEVVLSSNQYWKRVQGHQIDQGKRYQHILKLWSGHRINFVLGNHISGVWTQKLQNMVIFDLFFCVRIYFWRPMGSTRSDPIIKQILKTCSGTSNWPRKTISTHSKTLIGTSKHFGWTTLFWGGKKNSHLWIYIL